MHSKNRNTRLSRGVALAAFGALVAAGCEADREDFITAVGDVILDMAIEAQSPTLPSGAGTIDEFVLVSFDPDAGDDAFGTATGALGLFQEIETTFGPAMGWNLGLGVRNSSQDPRLPTLVASSGAVGSFLGLFNPSWTGVAAGWWDLFGEVTGLAPNTTYTIALARMSLTVNGELDAQEMQLTGMVTDPDELSYFGGSETGSSTITCNFSAGVGVDVGRNPVSLGMVTTDGSGDATIDCLPVAVGNSPWWRDFDSQTPAAAADSTPVGINATAADGGEVLDGQYNYVLIFEGLGDPVPNGAPTLRIQIGPDIDASGNVIPKAFAPFPDGQASDAELLAGSGGIGQSSAMTFSVTGLAPLTGAYQVWLVNAETGEMISPSGDVTVSNVDEMGMDVIVSESSGNTFNPTDPSDVVTFTTSDDLAGAPVGPYTHLFVSIEAAAAGTPSEAKPLWAQYTEMNGAPGDASMWQFFEDFDLPFGTFDSSEPGASIVFDPSGFGTGAFTGEEFGTADYFRARFRNVARPPVGYFYEGFMRQVADGEVASESSTGDLTTEFSEGFASLRDVDINPSISTAVGPSVIVESANRATLAEVGSPFETFEEYALKLRPKLAASPTEGFVVALGLIPEPLKAREGSE